MLGNWFSSKRCDDQHLHRTTEDAASCTYNALDNDFDNLEKLPPPTRTPRPKRTTNESAVAATPAGSPLMELLQRRNNINPAEASGNSNNQVQLTSSGQDSSQPASPLFGPGPMDRAVSPASTAMVPDTPQLTAANLDRLNAGQATNPDIREALNHRNRDTPLGNRIDGCVKLAARALQDIEDMNNEHLARQTGRAPRGNTAVAENLMAAAAQTEADRIRETQKKVVLMILCLALVLLIALAIIGIPSSLIAVLRWIRRDEVAYVESRMMEQAGVGGYEL